LGTVSLVVFLECWASQEAKGEKGEKKEEQVVKMAEQAG